MHSYLYVACQVGVGGRKLFSLAHHDVMVYFCIRLTAWVARAVVVLLRFNIVIYPLTGTIRYQETLK